MAVNRSSLNKTVPNSVKRAFKRKIKKWEQEGLVDVYFKYMLDSLKKYTYSNILKACVYATYAEAETKIFKESKQVFTTVANDCYKQAKKEIIHCPITVPDILTWAYISKWLNVFSLNCSYEEYLQTLTMTDSDEMFKKCIQAINSESELKEEDIAKLIEKQQNRVLKIGKDETTGSDKFSGIIESMSRTVGNKAYIQPFPNQQVKFVAELDSRTTKMCLSLNGQIFNTIDTNKFKRYSDKAKTEVSYETKGLVQGINLPPIEDHFHWCRSTITYQINKTINELEKEIFGINLETYNLLKEVKEKGLIFDKINKEKQAKHCSEDKSFDKNRSYIYGSVEDAEKLYKKYSGHGEANMSKSGEIREFVKTKNIVGYYQNKNTGDKYKSSSLVIIHSKTGAHLYAGKDSKGNI